MKKVNPCPVCGGKHIFMVTAQSGWRKHHVECLCHFGANSAFTKWGAIRKWNRMKREVRDADIF